MGIWFSRKKTSNNCSDPQANSTDVTASAQVDKRGGVYISSQQISELPEVKEMRRLAATIVKQDLATVRK
ncbi:MULTISPECIES: hypothetical protein [unclassified Symbiopectobacterium]|uniref:hypothetical protein n=1 Tax=unclassified Symbiopectobacterium TaxID=2794573 RepID=UPI002225D72C|nr:MULTISPECIES: hypothetical protein [unclassified Symbiopectobacterium]MCW2475225.1 hypothetical protein [Candidatus Symbiopectobacterium sp. NZEC151]MCW2482640.1 hypothetical protein [Candidatus Symbiopectobacterium sp. NZEC135]MCW2486596.1 hypothetical protein [Candidatus Symbiopectobacterium sp. NZEC127]